MSLIWAHNAAPIYLKSPYNQGNLNWGRAEVTIAMGSGTPNTNFNLTKFFLLSWSIWIEAGEELACFLNQKWATGPLEALSLLLVAFGIISDRGCWKLTEILCLVEKEGKNEIGNINRQTGLLQTSIPKTTLILYVWNSPIHFAGIGLQETIVLLAHQNWLTPL